MIPLIFTQAQGIAAVQQADCDLTGYAPVYY